MDSTLGKVLAAILGLLALAGVAIAGYVGYTHAKTSSAVADVATLATKIRGDYVNNPAGYATLSNQVAIAAGDVPADMLQGSSILNAWGSAVTIGPVAGTPKDFAINLGNVPQAACVELLTADGDLMGAAVGGKQVALPMSVADAATACAGATTSSGVPMTVQYGQSKVPVAPPCAVSTQSFTIPGTYAVTVPTGCSTVDFAVLGAAGGFAPNAAGGAGAKVTGAITESYGTQLTVVVGTGGATATGYLAGSGGGFSALEDASGYVGLAGGGGGAGGFGGNGYGGAGGAAGLLGSNGLPGCDPRTAGYGASQTAPGQGTVGYPQAIICGGNAGGAAGVGMTGAAPTSGGYGNGGGGGGGNGFFGGGAGSSGGSYGGGGGGGAGSSYASMAATSVVVTTGGGASGQQSSGGPGANGSVTLTFQP